MLGVRDSYWTWGTQGVKAVDRIEKEIEVAKKSGGRHWHSAGVADEMKQFSERGGDEIMQSKSLRSEEWWC